MKKGLGARLHSKRTISIFEIVAGYFVDVFYNTLYIGAKRESERSNNSKKSITDIYRGFSTLYLYGTFKEHDKYLYVVKGLHEYYMEVINNSIMTFSEFVNIIVGEFVPEEYYGDISGREKDKILGDVIKRLITRLSSKCNNEFIGLIIDERPNVRPIQDDARECLFVIRDEYYLKFVNQINGGNSGGGGGNVSIDVVNKVKAALVEQVKLRCSVEKERDKLNNIAVELRDKLKQINREFNATKKELVAVKSERDELNSKQMMGGNDERRMKQNFSSFSSSAASSSHHHSSPLSVSNATSITNNDIYSLWGNENENENEEEEEMIIPTIKSLPSTPIPPQHPTHDDNKMKGGEEGEEREEGEEDEEDELAEQRRMIEERRKRQQQQ